MKPLAATTSDSVTDPVSILYVIGSLEIGGAERHLAQIVPRLDRTRWEPTIYALTHRGSMAEVIERQGVRVCSSHIPSFLRGSGYPARGVRLALVFVQLVAHMVRHKPRLVHYFLPGGYLIGFPATFVARVLTLFTGASCVRVMSRRSLNLYQQKRPFLGRLERWLHGGCAAVLGNSRAVVSELESEGVRPERLHLIYNGIEVPPARTLDLRAQRAALGLPDEAVVLTQVANLIPYKGHGDLLEAFAKLQRAVSCRLALCIVGRDDGIGPQLMEKARQLGIADHVKWLGARSDVAAILAASDIGVLSSHQEGFSNAILEGMMAGLPMVVTRVGGNPEAVIDGETGFVVEPHDPDAMARMLARLASDPTLRQRLGNAARKRVETCFSVQRCRDEYEALYGSLVRGSNIRTAGDRQ